MIQLMIPLVIRLWRIFFHFSVDWLGGRRTLAAPELVQDWLWHQFSKFEEHCEDFIYYNIGVIHLMIRLMSWLVLTIDPPYTWQCRNLSDLSILRCLEERWRISRFSNGLSVVYSSSMLSTSPLWLGHLPNYFHVRHAGIGVVQSWQVLTTYDVTTPVTSSCVYVVIMDYLLC